MDAAAFLELAADEAASLNRAASVIHQRADVVGRAPAVLGGVEGDAQLERRGSQPCPSGSQLLQAIVDAGIPRHWPTLPRSERRVGAGPLRA